MHHATSYFALCNALLAGSDLARRQLANLFEDQGDYATAEVLRQPGRADLTADGALIWTPGGGSPCVVGWLDPEADAAA
jgi:hypothetical protein